MNRFLRRRRRLTGSVYGPARHRFVDARYAAALLEVGYLCQTEGGAAFRRRLLSVAAVRDVAPADPSATPADAPFARVLAFHGELDVSKKESIESALTALERFAPATVAILDLSDVQYLDTTFLNALLRANRLFGSGTVNRPRIVAPKRSMPSRILALTKLDTQFDVFENLAAAQL